MIDQVDKQLGDWVKTVLPAVEISYAPPAPEPAGQTISLYLIELASLPPSRSLKRTPLQIGLRYLVTSAARTIEEAHRLLGELVFAAMEHTDFEVDLEPLPLEIWQSFGIAPRPSFVLRLPLRKERPEPQVHYVRKPLVTQAVPGIGLYGLLLGPGDLPLAEARVELPALRQAELSDRQGRFYFPLVPASPDKKELLVRVKGIEMPATIDRPTSADEPFVIHVPLPEG